MLFPADKKKYLRFNFCTSLLCILSKDAIIKGRSKAVKDEKIGNIGNQEGEGAYG